MTSYRWAVVVAGVLLPLQSPECEAQVSVSPAAPKSQEIVRVVVPQVFNDPASQNQTQYNSVAPYGTEIGMSANRITVTVTMAKSDFPSPPAASLDVVVGQLPAGSYEVVVNRKEPNGNAFGTVGTTPFVVSPRTSTEPQWNHTDMWWDPLESGWGLNVVHHGGSNKIFATWFVYGSDGKATWFVVPDGQWTSPGTYVGAVYRATGPSYTQCTLASCPIPFNPALVVRELVGEIRLAFLPNGAHSASVLITIDGNTIQKSLQRQSF